MLYSLHIQAQTDKWNMLAYYAFSYADSLHLSSKDNKASKQLYKAIKTMQDSISPEVYKSYKQMADLYRLQAKEGKIKLKKYGDEIKIPILLDSVGYGDYRTVQVFINGSIKGKNIRILFDSGSSNNVITPQLCQELGLKDTHLHLDIQGTDTASNGVTFADELLLGNIKLQHLPFLIDSLNTEDVDKESGIAQYDAIIGLPLLRILGKTTIDFDKHLITSDDISDGNVEPNLIYRNLRNMYYLEYEHGGKKLTAIPDFGAVTSVLGESYNENYPDTLSLPTDSMSFLGYGGEKQTAITAMSNYDITIAGYHKIIPSILAIRQDGFDDLLGMDYFSKFHRVIFNLRNNTLRVE